MEQQIELNKKHAEFPKSGDVWYDCNDLPCYIVITSVGCDVLYCAKCMVEETEDRIIKTWCVNESDFVAIATTFQFENVMLKRKLNVKPNEVYNIVELYKKAKGLM